MWAWFTRTYCEYGTGNNEEVVLEFVTDTVAEYTNHGRSGDESQLFSIMVRLATY